MTRALLFPLTLLVAGPKAALHDQAQGRAQGSWGVAYAPADASAPRPALVFLHGMWASPEDSCEPFARAGTPFGFVVCPRGNAPLNDPDPRWQGYKMWSGGYADAARPIQAALEAAEALAPGKRAHQGGTLLGFSNGAYFATEVACSEPGRWTGLVLIGMRLDLDPGRLRRAGVTRVVLAAGDRDESRASMRSQAAHLNENGVEAQFASLGDVGHAFPDDMSERMCAAIAWVRHAPGEACGGRGGSVPSK